MTLRDGHVTHCIWYHAVLISYKNKHIKPRAIEPFMFLTSSRKNGQKNIIFGWFMNILLKFFGKSFWHFFPQSFFSPRISAREWDTGCAMRCKEIGFTDLKQNRCKAKWTKKKFRRDFKIVPIHLSFHPSVHPSVHSSTLRYTHLYVCLSIHSSVRHVFLCGSKIVVKHGSLKTKVPLTQTK